MLPNPRSSGRSKSSSSSGMTRSASTTAARFNQAAAAGRAASIDSSRSSAGRIGRTVRRPRPTGRGVAAGGADAAAIAPTRRGAAHRIRRGEDRGRPSRSRRASPGNPNRLVPVGRHDSRDSPDNPGKPNAGRRHARTGDPIPIRRRMAEPGRGRRDRLGTRSGAAAVAGVGAAHGRMDRRQTVRRAMEGNPRQAPDVRRAYLRGIEWCS